MTRKLAFQISQQANKLLLFNQFGLLETLYQRERERGREGGRERERKRERASEQLLHINIILLYVLTTTNEKSISVTARSLSLTSRHFYTTAISMLTPSNTILHTKSSYCLASVCVLLTHILNKSLRHIYCSLIDTRSTCHNNIIG